MVDASLHIECPKKTFRPLQKVDLMHKITKNDVFFKFTQNSTICMLKVSKHVFSSDLDAKKVGNTSFMIKKLF